jgi:hypothetical protein
MNIQQLKDDGDNVDEVLRVCRMFDGLVVKIGEDVRTRYWDGSVEHKGRERGA